MENINNKNDDKYKCIFISNTLNQNTNKYIQSAKFILENSFLIFNNKKITKYNYSYNSSSTSFDLISKDIEYIEKDYIYDYDIIFNQNDSNSILCLCSKDNPIRILNGKLSLIKSFTLENKQRESYLSSIFIRYEPFGLTIYTGKNFLTKIDLIKQKEINTIYNKYFNFLSCFDFDVRYSCYFLGSYSNNLIICDYKTDKIINIHKQEKPVNQIKILKSKDYQMIVGYRNSDYISLFDIRKMDKNIYKMERNAKSTKKINFIFDDKECNLYTGTDNGKLVRYYNFDRNNIINKEEIDIGVNDCITSIDLNNDKNLMIVTNGENYFDEKFNSLININDSEEELDNHKLNYLNSQFQIYKII